MRQGADDAAGRPADVVWATLPPLELRGGSRKRKRAGASPLIGVQKLSARLCTGVVQLRYRRMNRVLHIMGYCGVN
jgi:hypothetical protein